MADLPIDTSNPAIRDYLALARLQVLTPLSVLINIGAVGVCSYVLDPSLGKVSKMYPTSITPSPKMITTYVIAIFVTQIGYCAILVFARRSDTKQTLIKGSGLAVVFANWIMAFWAIAWAFQAFIISSILLGILVVLLLYPNIVLAVYHPSNYKRPLDALLIHFPIRAFLILPLTIMLPVSIFIALGHYWTEGDTKAYDNYMWEGFAVFFSINILGLVFIAVRRDIVWAVGAAWLAASVWNAPPKSAPVSISAILFTFLHPIVLVVCALWVRMRSKRRNTGPIALPPDEAGNPSEASGHAPGANSGGRSAVSRVWG
ncbi:hypothetical protein SCHPADRAFT_914398 [Schizopora paradoxa]|uniref:Uncharacterized protein n=1 Tax=Schizopora paradoxa TaxID=27342 RepID=A0A0H2RUI1_9AGAM|nr:hypothetical protein SCHPADRAFT_914398 [Schizopora paradoxa]